MGRTQWAETSSGGLRVKVGLRKRLDVNLGKREPSARNRASQVVFVLFCFDLFLRD